MSFEGSLARMYDVFDERQQVVERVERVAAGERKALDIRMVELRDEVVAVGLSERLAAVEIPSLRVLATRTVMGAAGEPQRDAEAFAVVHVAARNIMKTHSHA